MSNNKLYSKTKVSNEAQQRVLDLHRSGETELDISRITKLQHKQVHAIIENGIVALKRSRQKRCGCGALLASVPCLACQLAGVVR